MNMVTRVLFCAALTLGCGPAFAAGKYIAYVGTYTGGPSDSKGIYGLQLDSGKLKNPGVEAEVASPSFLATDSRHRFLYAVTERMAKNDPTGYLSAYAIDPATGALHFLNRMPAKGTTSAHLIVDRTNRWLIVANYGSGSVASFALKPDGSIGDMADFHQHSGSSVNARRQKGPHPHEVVMSPDNRFVIVPDLGVDKVFSYQFDANSGKLTLNDAGSATVPPGFGPRHFVFGKGGRFAYVLGEMGSKVIAMSYDAAHGKLTPIQTIDTIPADFKDENNSGELALDASGQFLYASNRGHDSVALFSIDARTGLLKLEQIEPSGGKIPRNIVIDPSERHLLAANQDSDNIVIFNRDQINGRLTPTGEVLNLPSPVCIVFVPLNDAK
ncbi:MAG TPA: lactonase family protein [Rhizomicrobium sp.]|nr:lactonase family protein [Rhizomicrobium sp.]